MTQLLLQYLEKVAELGLTANHGVIAAIVTAFALQQIDQIKFHLSDLLVLADLFFYQLSVLLLKSPYLNLLCLDQLSFLIDLVHQVVFLGDLELLVPLIQNFVIEVLVLLFLDNVLIVQVPFLKLYFFFHLVLVGGCRLVLLIHFLIGSIATLLLTSRL